jgi:hypothetical protein
MTARLESLPPPPRRIAALPKDPRGYPVPGKIARRGEGAPDFRVINDGDRLRAFMVELCWICGQSMGVHRVYAIGPMCVVNRTTMEPAAHRECAEYAVKACPFLARPRMKRLPSDDIEDKHVVGVMIERNPGVTCLYETREAKADLVGNDRWLIRLGDADRVDWWREGRKATRAEVETSIETGLPNLDELARLEGPAAIRELARLHAAAIKLMPAA